jgi:DNA-binding transcriptional LysR family regulator
MDVRQLEYVVSVADEQNFTRAAARCHVAQSALSHQVARLEAEFGVRIFDRTSRSVRLTEAGETFLPYARQILDDYASARATLDQLAGITRGRLRIGLTQDAVRSLDLIGLFGKFHRRYPAIALSTTTGPGQELVDAISDDLLDLAFAAIGSEGGPEDVIFLPLVEEPLVAIVPSDHPIANRKRVRLAELAQDEFIELRLGTTLRKVMDSAFADAGIRRNSGFEVGQIAEMVLYVANGLGTAIVPRAFVSGTPTGSSSAPEIGLLRLVEPNLHLEIGVFARKDRLSTPSRRFLELVSQDSSAVATFLHSTTEDRSSGTV